MKKIRLTLPKLHEAQELVARSLARFRVVCCGRRWGKTLLGASIAMIEASGGGRVWWIAPSFSQANEGWTYLRQLARQLPRVKIREDLKSIVFPGGGSVELKTADDPNRLRGSGLDLVIFDECSAIYKDEIWNEVIRPALADREGKALFLSTPRGINWFFTIFNYGAGAGHPDWESWQFPTSSNPWIPGSEIKANEDQLPTRVFAQEWLAEFLQSDGAVFSGIKEVSTALLDEKGGYGHFAFVDMAEVYDYNAVSIFKEEGDGGAVQVFVDHWRKTSWPVSRSRITAAMTKYKGQWGFDRSGKDMDDVFLNEIRAVRTGSHASTVKFNRANKPQMVENMVAMMDNRKVRFLRPDQCEAAEAQERELVSYTATAGSGYTRYSAPPGAHDDIVCADYGALWILRKSAPVDMEPLRRVMEVMWS